MAYELKYRLEKAPESKMDGSGQVLHTVAVVYRDDDTPWNVAQKVPNHTTSILVPASAISAVMALPDNTGTERQAKNNAYKNLLVQYRNAKSLALDTQWNQAAILQFLSNNAASLTAATEVNDYITSITDYPVPFDI